MAQGSASQAQLLRKKAEPEEDEKEVKGKPAKEARRPISFTVIREASVDAASRSVRMVVINEGLGNKRDLRYYGGEAIESVARRINGAKCYMNHKTAQQELERPEGDMWGLAGYWKDAAIQMVDGKKGAVATLMCNDSETGEAAFEQCKHALKYSADFPGSAEVYCGTSINGDGTIEVRKMVVDGMEMEVNYVTEVTDLPSADLVTQPARGGRVLAMVESMRGAQSREEAKAMAGKSWHALLMGLIESIRGSKADEKVLSTVEAEAGKMKAAEEAEEEARKRKESETAAEACKGSEDEAEESEDEGGDEPGHAEPDGDEPAEKKPGAKKTSIIKHEERHTVAGESEKKIRDLERQLREEKAKNELPAVEALLKESGVKVEAKDVLAMPASSRKAFLGLLESMRGGFTATGETLRGTEGTVESGAFKGLAESVSVRAGRK